MVECNIFGESEYMGWGVIAVLQIKFDERNTIIYQMNADANRRRMTIEGDTFMICFFPQ